MRSTIACSVPDGTSGHARCLSICVEVLALCVAELKTVPAGLSAFPPLSPENLPSRLAYVSGEIMAGQPPQSLGVLSAHASLGTHAFFLTNRHKLKQTHPDEGYSAQHCCKTNRAEVAYGASARGRPGKWPWCRAPAACQRCAGPRPGRHSTASGSSPATRRPPCAPPPGDSERRGTGLRASRAA